eukprot:TRINITY_DN3879_c0_g2_i1.p2 TRINITY_DN3879_c0_g2~~TRINITY_DN3879_c0_g2_i1.p2  ORF type:complete len:195 (-),score=56.04 TRINITY_DN3879_c0_g2_i1:63-647(-)
MILSDEVWSDFTFQGITHTPLGKLASPNSITIFGPTKSFNIAALGISLAIIPDKKTRDAVRQQYSKGGFFGGNVFSEVALQACYSPTGEAWLNELKTYINKNVDCVVQCCQKSNGRLIAIRPESGYLVWIDCRNWKSSDPRSLSEIFKSDARVWLSDGTEFGEGGSGFVRINVGCQLETVQLAMDRILQLVLKN